MNDHIDDFADLQRRVESLEQAVEGVFRPIADVLPLERIQFIEQTAYESVPRLSSVEARIANLETQVSGILDFITTLQNTLVWRTLAGTSKVITRLAGRATNSQ